ncbi:unnamed protein product [Cylindrotheca closterium]|uniref:VWFA domain-containing protein n=1 Tax=Cylindrotheca closterium TaxID=2856 RepID=A0AAD2JIV4_9STRA|nr:unnamed protein product [Cylindrotheca closterium]
MKQAVVFVLDSNVTMAKEYENGSSRFDCAKQVAQDLICDLMIQSKTNEVGVIVLKSNTTRHHFYEPDSDNEDTSMDDDEEIPYQNILEFGGSGDAVMVARPTPSLLRKIDSLQVSKESESLRGDFCDGIIVAADSLYKRTNKKKYQRRIVLITDAEHRVEVDGEQLSEVLNGLCDLECTLEVIGLDFGKEAKFSKPSAGEETAVKVEPKQDEKEDDDSATDAGSETDAGEDNDDDEDGGEVGTALIKSQNESLLISMTEKTGGYVMAAKELKAIFATLLGKRKSKSTRRKVDFQIAPGVSMECRFSLLLSKATLPSLKKRVVPDDTAYSQKPKNEDEDDAKKSDDVSPEDMLNMKRIESHFDAENEEVEITNRGQAYKYGSDLVPMSAYDMGGLTAISDVKLKIIGYIPNSRVPKAFCVGPPYILSGADSRKACAAVSALARGLERTKKVAIASFVQMKNRDPSLVGIFPNVSQLREGKSLEEMTEEEKLAEKAKYENPVDLIIFKLPYMGDVVVPGRIPLEEHDKSKEKVCDDLIDALTLEGDQLDYTRIANPMIRSYWKTVVARVKDPEHELVMARNEKEDEIATPEKVLEGAKGALDAFYESFPLPPANRKTAKK